MNLIETVLELDFGLGHSGESGFVLIERSLEHPFFCTCQMVKSALGHFIFLVSV